MPIKRANNKELLGSSQLTKHVIIIINTGFSSSSSQDENSTLKFSIKVICKIWEIGDGIVH
jgi:hypothetical protein